MITGLTEKIQDLEWAGARKDQISILESSEGVSEATELWRYSDIDSLDLSNLKLAAEPSSADSKFDISVVDGWLGSNKLPDGVSCEISTPEAIGAEQDYFDTAALIVSPHQINVTLTADADLSIGLQSSSQGAVTSPQLNVAIDKGRSQNILICVDCADETLTLPSIALSVAERVTATVTVLTTGSATAKIIGSIHVTQGAQSNLKLDLVSVGAGYCRYRSTADLVGRGASLKVVSPSYLDGTQASDNRLFVNHNAADTTSDLLFRNVVDGESSSVYTGLIKIHENGAGTNAVQENRTLKLSDTAWAHSVPNLEIENNEVACSHASTVSPVDYEQQFYLQSRGVSADKVDDLIVRGFIASVVSRLSHPKASELVSQMLDAKLAGDA